MTDLAAFSDLVQISVAALRDALPDTADQLRLLPRVYRQTSGTGIAATHIRRTLLSGIARAVAAHTLSTRGEATALLASLVPIYDAEIALTDDLAAWQALRSLRAAIVRDVSARALQLPDLVTVTSPTPLPSLVLAHRLYLDATRADEITERNDPVNPLFCGPSIEALSS